MSEPSAEALSLADKLITIRHSPYSTSQYRRQSWAAVIDAELQLPQRNAALLLAQGVVDAWHCHLNGPMAYENMKDAIGELTEALTRIKK